MVNKMSNFHLRVITTIVGFSLLWSMYTLTNPLMLEIFLVGYLLILLLTEWPQFIKKWNFKSLLFTLIYPCAAFFSLILLALDPVHRTLLPLLCFMVFAHDIFAYFVGKLIGRYPLAPTISAHKTIEGFIGGCAGTLTVTMWYTQLQLPKVFMFSLIISSIATLGDLFESYLKRRVGLKDSGNVLPGHGGLLDRVDSFLFVAPIFYFWRDAIAFFLGL